MDTLITLQNISLAFGLNPLLDHADCQIQTGERVCLIGRNGAGKSSLLKIIEGSLQPDSGTVWRKPHLRVARLAQDLPHDTDMTVYECVAKGLADIGSLLATYHDLTHTLADNPSTGALTQLEQVQKKMDALQGWEYERRIETILTRLELPADKRIAELSGGWQRRVGLAQALVISPDLLLLDEPTNHLDIEAIQWLENELVSDNVTLLFITHDRALLKRLATRILELDRGQLTSWPGDYDNFLRRKEERLHAEAKANDDFDKKLAEEERWIRQGIKARRTRNEGRVRALEAMRFERTQRRDVDKNPQFALNTAEKSGKLVVEAKNVSYQYTDQPIVRDFSIRIQRGDRIGFIGPNGVGKSTLINLLLGILPPQHGTIQLGTELSIAYFDQRHAALDLEKTVIENVQEGSDFITINGKPKHIISYLSDFLFTPERTRTPVSALSGGERNRLLLARLFSKPTNLLILDEPTNDLDIETLELLEELLTQYSGTLLIVSHDRAFLDNVVTSVLVFEGNGTIREYIGGYSDWLLIKERQEKMRESQSPAIKKSMESFPQKETSTRARKLSYKEQKEYDELPTRIETLEREEKRLQDLINTPDFYQQSQENMQKTLLALKDCTEAIQKAYARYAELDER